MKKFITHDISIAAFLLLKRQVAVNIGKDATGKYIFEFLDEENVCKALSLEFFNSDFSNYDGFLKYLRTSLK